MHGAQFSNENTDADERLRRLYKIVEDGMAEVDEILKDRIDQLKSDRSRARTAAENVERQ